MIYEKLSKIQQEMKAPKNLKNSFGGYMYRNAEGILEAFKPYEAKYGVVLKLDDAVVHEEGERYYIKSTATIIDTDTGEKESVSAYARESETKNGMDDSQITGTASSYARKYALNGLLLLDDTKDADTEEYADQQDDSPANEVRKKVIETICLKHKIDIKQLCVINALEWDNLTDVQAGKLLNSLKAKFGDD